jgi:outer membrane protein assembly factor BamB
MGTTRYCSRRSSSHRSNDTGGDFYALDAATGEKLWGQDLGGAIADGVITYTAGVCN